MIHPQARFQKSCRSSLKARRSCHLQQTIKYLAAICLVSSLFTNLGKTHAEPVDANPQSATPRPPIVNQASFTYTNPANKQRFQSTSAQLSVSPEKLIDPLGRILGCNGALLPDYAGFSVGMYEANPSDPTGTELGQLVPLTGTEVPDAPDNSIPGGLRPNAGNLNPFFLSNAVPTEERGRYNFLLDPNKGQLTPGRSYILLVNSPPGNLFGQRRVKIQIVESTGTLQNNVVRYVATSLDGQPIVSTGEKRVEDFVVAIANAETQGLDLLAFQFTSRLCQPNQAEIIKSADHSAAEPGDSVVYRLSIKSKSDSDLKDVVVTDILPAGFRFLAKSVQGEIDGQRVAVTATAQGATITFRLQGTIPPGKVLNIAYGSQLTPDAIRGTGRNTASMTAKRADNNFELKDGPATHQLRLRYGLLSDSSIIIGRVFDDKNWDGEQQANEPGIPNAVIFLDDGNRVTTDVNGLFSVANALPGHRSGVLDLSSIPGYTLAPNQRFSERNSQSRLVHLAPNSMVRMNFAVTPTSKKADQK